jgi:ubiquitin-conjugating enzyme E2 G1
MNKAITYINKAINDYIADDSNHYFEIYNDSENIFEWNFSFFPPIGSLYEGEYYNGIISFPNDFPNNPPQIKFITPLFHPNIYNNGIICISILHSPGEDQFNYELANERWLPVHTLSSIFLSILNLILEPNLESPANIDASILYKKDKKIFRRYIRGIK